MAANTMPSHHSNKDGLRLSLQRLGYRLKNLFRPSPSQYSLDADQPLSTLHPDSPLPTKAPELRQTSNSSDPSVTRPATEVNPVKAIENITWAGLGNSLQILVQSSGLFPPLRAVAGDLLETLDVFQAAAKSREDYNELALELSTIINDVANYLAESKSVQISESLMRVVDGLEKQIKHIHERQRRGAAKRYVEAADDIDDLIVCYRRIDALFRQLQNNVVLSTWNITNEQLANTRLEGIHPAKQAWYNAGGSGQVRRRGCTPNTRQAILEKLRQWAHAHTDPKVYWMNGMAGTGKTTIAYSFCAELEKTHQLAASFFCSRTLPDCREATRVIPTIAYQLARFSYPFQAALCKILGTDPDIDTRGITTQFQKLLKEPLLEAKNAVPAGLVVVIDALDECFDRNNTQAILESLLYNSRELPIKFFIACRPEPGILERLMPQDDFTRSVLHLHDIEGSLVQKDIETYLCTELGSSSISEEDIMSIAERSGNLFIYAATAVRYLRPESTSVDLRRRLGILLGTYSNSASKAYQHLDALYNTILASALENPDLEFWEVDNIKLLLYTVICSKEPVTIDTLASLLGLDGKSQVRSSLEALLSVLHVSESNEIVSVLHASFPDYMLSPERSTRFFFDRAHHEGMLAERCFCIMKKSLRFNICNLESSFVVDLDVPDLSDRVSRTITSHLFYACQYWCDHLEYAWAQSVQFVSYSDWFMSHQLLYWMEVLNLKGCIINGVSILLRAHVWLQNANAPASLCALSRDAQTFLTFFCANPVSRSTPHIYTSVLAFWPRTNAVWLQYGNHTSGLVDIQGPEIISRQLGAISVWTDGSKIECISVSPDGNRVASGSRASTVLVRDSQSGAIVAGPFEGHTGSVNSIAFSSDGARIISGSHDSTIRIWDVQSGNTIAGPFKGHTGSVTSVSFSSDGSRVVSGSQDCTIVIWDALSGEIMAGPFKHHTDVVTSVVFSPDGSYVVSGSRDSTLLILDAWNGEVVSGPFEGHVSQVNSVEFSPNGNCVASGSEDRTVCIWDARNMAIITGPLKGHTGPVKSVAFSPDGVHIASGCTDGGVLVWSVLDGTVVAGPFEGHTNQISTVTFSPNGRYILSGSWDHTIRTWELHKKVAVPELHDGHAGLVKSVTFSPDGAFIASGGNDGSVYVWNTHNGAIAAGPFEGHTDSINSVAFSPDGARIVSASYDCTIRIWDIHSANAIAKVFKGHSAYVTCAVFSPDGARVASSSHDCTIRIWDAYNGDIVAGPFTGHTALVSSVAFSPDGTRVVSGSWDSTVRIWDAHGGRVIVELPKLTTNFVSSVAFSPDGVHIVSASWDRTIYIWDARDGSVAAGPFTGHTDCINSVAFSNNGSAVVSGSWDHTVRIWDADSGAAVIKPLEGHMNWVSSVAFSPDGTRVVSGSGDHAIRVWELKSSSLEDGFSWDKWSLNEDGWVVGPDSQLLLWVPPELRAGLKRPENSIVVHRRGVLKLRFNDALIGHRWRECYSD